MNRCAWRAPPRASRGRPGRADGPRRPRRSGSATASAGSAARSAGRGRARAARTARSPGGARPGGGRSGTRRRSASRRRAPSCVRFEIATKRVNASGWSPTSAASTTRPCSAAARSLAIATSVGSASRATCAAASAVVPAAIACRARQRGEQAPALVERHGMRAHDADLRQRHLGDADEEVPDRQDRLLGDRRRRVDEQVVRLGDRAGDRALDRQHARVDAGRRDGGDDVGERRQRLSVILREEQRARGGAVSAFAAGVGDLHRSCHAASSSASRSGVRPTPSTAGASAARRERLRDADGSAALR